MNWLASLDRLMLLGVVRDLSQNIKVEKQRDGLTGKALETSLMT